MWSGKISLGQLNATKLRHLTFVSERIPQNFLHVQLSVGMPSFIRGQNEPADLQVLSFTFDLEIYYATRTTPRCCWWIPSRQSTKCAWKISDAGHSKTKFIA